MECHGGDVFGGIDVEKLKVIVGRKGVKGTVKIEKN